MRRWRRGTTTVRPGQEDPGVGRHGRRGERQARHEKHVRRGVGEHLRQDQDHSGTREGDVLDPRPEGVPTHFIPSFLGSRGISQLWIAFTAPLGSLSGSLSPPGSLSSSPWLSSAPDYAARYQPWNV